jgi:hypothetical protein
LDLYAKLDTGISQ